MDKLNEEGLIEKIRFKKEFVEIPIEDIKMALKQFERSEISDEDKVKRVRDILRKIYSGFGGRKIFMFNDKSPEEVLEKHISTRERLEHYEEIYKKLLSGFDTGKNVSVIDLGAGVNGFSYNFFEKCGFSKVRYVGVEAVGQLVTLMDNYFEENGLDAKAVHLSIFNKEELVRLINKQKTPKVVFMLKVIDSLEVLKRNYTLELLEEMKKLEIERFVISFATRSWFKRRKFYAQRKWLTNFIEKNFNITDDFELGGERYIVFEK